MNTHNATTNNSKWRISEELLTSRKTIIGDTIDDINDIPGSTFFSYQNELKKCFVNPKEPIGPPATCLSSGYDELSKTSFATRGNLSLVTGKAKSRKTFFTSIALAATSKNSDIQKALWGELPEEKSLVLHFDTEQSKYHTQQVVKRVCKLMDIEKPDNYRAFSLRSYSPAERLNLIEYCINQEPHLGFVIIDGIRDLVTSINDEHQATEISSKLLKWTEEKDIHLMTVLHQNKGDNNTVRGHLGTELVNKAETIISIVKDRENNDFSIVDFTECRGMAPKSLAFSIDDDGLPELLQDYEPSVVTNGNKKSIGPSDIPEPMHREVLKKVFKSLPKPSYQQLWGQIKTEFLCYAHKLGDNKVKEFVKWYLAQGLIRKEGAANSKAAYYVPKIEL